ncbi:MAG: hypothetical protein QOJ66_3294, partial [Ilumatobacteraceae bacterium]
LVISKPMLSMTVDGPLMTKPA